MEYYAEIDSHCESGPASSPIRAISKPRPLHQAKASGSLATLASRTIRPVASTTQRLELSSETSPRGDDRARLLTTVPGVGSIVALTFASAIDDPGRFKSSKTVGALLVSLREQNK